MLLLLLAAAAIRQRTPATRDVYFPFKKIMQGTYEYHHPFFHYERTSCCLVHTPRQNSRFVRLRRTYHLDHDGACTAGDGRQPAPLVYETTFEAAFCSKFLTNFDTPFPHG